MIEKTIRGEAFIGSHGHLGSDGCHRRALYPLPCGKTIVKHSILVLAMALGAACSRSPQAKGPEKHYTLTGKIVTLDKAHQTATIDAAAIPNYMEAMTMEYPVKSKAEFDSLKVGEQITGTLDVAADESYTLSNIKAK